MTDRKVLEKAISVYGPHLQKVVAIEEMSELTKEICKEIRNGEEVYSIINLIEEIVDVSIMLEQLKMIYGGDDLYKFVYNQKMNRLRERLGNDW